MAVDFNESQTKKNLETAFAGESQASMKYSYYAKAAKKEGYVQILRHLHGDLWQRARARQALVQVPPRR